MIPVIKDKIKLELKDIVKVHLYIKMIEKGLDITKLTNRELSVLSNLYTFGGLDKKEDIGLFSEDCFIRGLSDNSLQSIRNTLSKAQSIGLVKRLKVNKWKISEDYLPGTASDKLILDYTIHNIDI